MKTLVNMIIAFVTEISISNASENYRECHEWLTTYNGSSCGACNDRGAIGSFGQILRIALKTNCQRNNLNIMTNGVFGTMMMPHKISKPV